MSIDTPEHDDSLEKKDDPSSPVSSAGSLFGSDDEEEVIATRTPPRIPGLYVFPGLLPRELAGELPRSYRV